jgi:hypothetical protein
MPAADVFAIDDEDGSVSMLNAGLGKHLRCVVEEAVMMFPVAVVRVEN